MASFTIPIKCSECGSRINIKGKNFQDVRAKAHALGWSISSVNHTECPACVREKFYRANQALERCAHAQM